MENDILTKLNMSVLMLLNASTGKQIESSIVEMSRSLIGAQYGQFYIYSKDRYKKVFDSAHDIKGTCLSKQPQLKDILRTDTIQIVSKEDIKKWHIDTLPQEVTALIIVPYTHKNTTYGYSCLFTTDDVALSALTKNALALFTKTAILALTKYRMQEESKKSLELRDHFISLASHELRTPLTSIHGYIQLLYAKIAKEETAEARWVKELYTESNRLTTLVKELLDVNRIKQGQFAFTFNELYMRDVITKALINARAISGEHTIQFLNTIEANPVKIVGDFDKLVEMVTGLLENAIKFSKPDEQITISMKATQSMLCLIVSDTGRGISKKDMEALFDGFHKPSYASHIQGMGIGLVLAKHIVDNHRGKMKLSSKEHKGTKVEILLPIMK